MRKLIFVAVIFLMQQACAQPTFQLAPPMLNYTSAFFDGSTSFEVVFNQPGAGVRYTLNGKEPTEKDALYTSPVSITKKTTVKVKAFGKNFIPSETVTAQFITSGKAVNAVSFSKPNEYYTKEPDDVLHDNKGGILNYRSGGWLGYDSDTATLEVELKKTGTVNSVLISLLQDENAWIFLPEKIEVYHYDDKKKDFVMTAKETFTHATPGPKQSDMHSLKLAGNIKTNKLKLVLFPLKKIPDWHAGKGNHGWLFVDEIKVY